MADDALDLHFEIHGPPDALERVRGEAVDAFRAAYPPCWTFDPDDALGIVVRHTLSACARTCPTAADQGPETYTLSDALLVLLIGMLATTRPGSPPKRLTAADA